MPRLVRVVNVLAIRQVKQGTETTGFRIDTLYSALVSICWRNRQSSWRNRHSHRLARTGALGTEKGVVSVDEVKGLLGGIREVALWEKGGC